MLQSKQEWFAEYSYVEAYFKDSLWNLAYLNEVHNTSLLFCFQVKSIKIIFPAQCPVKTI